MVPTKLLREGLFRSAPDGPTLLAGNCARCGRTAFPTTERCLECGHVGVDVVELGAEGKLLCATVVHMPNGPYTPGHRVGYVVMPHGIRVFSQIGASGEALPPGTPMRLEIVPLWREDDHEVLGYRFIQSTNKEGSDA